MREISRAREYNELLLQLDNWQKDPMRHDRGLELGFRRGQAGLREKLMAFFTSRNFNIAESYAPDDARESKVVEMPARGEPGEKRQAA